MKVWKGAVPAHVPALVLLSVTALLLLTRTMQPARSVCPQTPDASARPALSSISSSSSSSSSSSPPSVSSLRTRGLRRTARETDGMGSLLTKFSYLFQSITEGELQKVIDMLAEGRSMVAGGRGRRTRRAKKDLRACSLHEVQLTVSELGLGYESDETVSFRYCSGRCEGRRRNYDLVMEHRRLGETSCGRAGRRGRGAKAESVRHGPCCRPTKYEKKMAFLDNNERFFTIKNVSARECGCV